ncbi:MAG: zf-HC2 domain-containing protein, partial [Planctomycetota bacterium]|nr:zf-HC2 domain-containing protein [Planctomycetota bacterium]
MNKTDAAPQNGHMGYLLTAYLFDSLSAAGRKEVEGHLAGCAQCREQLEALRLTLGAVVTALDKGGKEYVFEARRRVRVLEAAYHSRHSLLGEVPFIGGTNWKLAALAALLMVVVLLGLMVPTLARARAPMQEMLRKGGPTSHSRTFLDTSSDSGFAWGLFGSKKPAAPAPDAKPADKSADYDRRESGLVMITELKPAQPEMKTDDVKTADSKSEAPWRESTERQFAQGNVSRAPATPAPKPSEPPTTQSRTDTITAIAGAADEAFTAGRSTKGLPRPQPRVDTVTGKNAPSATTPARVAGEKPAPAAPAT